MPRSMAAPSVLRRALSPGPITYSALATMMVGAVLVFAPVGRPSVELFDEPKEALVAICAFAGGFALLFEIFSYQDSSVPEPPHGGLHSHQVVEIVAVATLLAEIASALTAQNGLLALRALSMSTATIAAFVLAARLPSASAIRLVELSAWLAAIVSMFFLAESLFPSTPFSPRGLGPAGPIGNRNYVASVLALGLPILRVRLLPWSRLSAFWLAVVSMSACAIVISRARSAWIMATAVVMLVLLELIYSVQSTARRRADVAFILAVAAGVSLVFLWPSSIEWTDQSPMESTAKRILALDGGSGRNRVIQMRISMGIVRQFPLTGLGTGNWSVEYPVHAQGSDPAVHRGALLESERVPQSEWIGRATERGVPALIGVLAIGTVLMISATTRSRALMADDPKRDLLVATRILLVTTFIGGLANPLLMQPAVVGWLAPTLGAIVVATRPQDELKGITLRCHLPLLAIITLLVCGTGAVLGVNRTRATLIVARDSSLGSVLRAVDIDRSNYPMRVALAAQLLDTHGCRSAERFIREALALHPTAELPRKMASFCASRR